VPFACMLPLSPLALQLVKRNCYGTEMFQNGEVPPLQREYPDKASGG